VRCRGIAALAPRLRGAPGIRLRHGRHEERTGLAGEPDRDPVFSQGAELAVDVASPLDIAPASRISNGHRKTLPDLPDRGVRKDVPLVRDEGTICQVPFGAETVDQRLEVAMFANCGGSHSACSSPQPGQMLAFRASVVYRVEDHDAPDRQPNDARQPKDEVIGDGASRELKMEGFCEHHRLPGERLTWSCDFRPARQCSSARTGSRTRRRECRS